MRGNAFGRPCLTLEETIEALTDIARLQPHLRQEPVWVDGEPMFCPITNIRVVATGGVPRIHVDVAR